MIAGESVVVVESDKADMDVETFYDGYLAYIAVAEGEVAPVGTAIGLLAETEAEIAEAKVKGAKAGNSVPAPAVAPAAPAPSPVEEAIVPPPPPPPTAAPVVATPVAVSTPSPEVDGDRRIIATPYAKKLAKQLKVDLARVTGSGPSGRITATDVEAAAGKVLSTYPVAAVSAPVIQEAPPASPKAIAAAVPSSSSAATPGSATPFTSMQSAISRNMVDSLTVPTFRVGYTITTDALDALYKKIKSKGVTMTALLAKAVALALAKHPVVNACCKDGKSFTYNQDINIAVAVAMDGGLLTPVLPNADKMDIYSLSRKWKELVDKARAKQLSPQEYTTGTFTLSNLGMFGVDRFDAILPPGTVRTYSPLLKFRCS
jgi:pyruvate dehydrogenase E2 component (dihydrolipoamide acetyltransferase)